MLANSSSSSESSHNSQLVLMLFLNKFLSFCRKDHDEGSFLVRMILMLLSLIAYADSFGMTELDSSNVIS